MGATKQTIYQFKTNDFSRTGQAMAHPARIEILKQLNQVGFSSNQSLANFLLLHESSISQHLKFLINGGLVEGFYVGRQHYYRLTKDAKKRMLALMSIVS